MFIKHIIKLIWWLQDNYKSQVNNKSKGEFKTKIFWKMKFYLVRHMKEDSTVTPEHNVGWVGGKSHAEVSQKFKRPHQSTVTGVLSLHWAIFYALLQHIYLLTHPSYNMSLKIQNNTIFMWISNFKVSSRVAHQVSNIIVQYTYSFVYLFALQKLGK